MITNENRQSPYYINNRTTVSPGTSSLNNRNPNNNENSNNHFETENKILRERLALKEKEIFQKDKHIKDLHDKISKLEIENRNLKRESNKKINKNLFFNLFYLTSEQQHKS